VSRWRRNASAECRVLSSVLLTPDGERTIVNHTDPRLFSTPPSVGASASQAAQVRATSLRATAVVA
jgi:hypothetical protein